ncbi:MAG: hypothetical protein RL318_900 [Fibrobacterota bacterium]|jgi:DNA helicase-2/ATP-dependent DNA helicase PcrA
MLTEERVRAELNAEQAEAVLVCNRPQLILAGAGSGKTRVLTWKIAWLVEKEGWKPWNIVALTFTNKAAKEMRERAEKIMGTDAPEWMGTFHGICARILRRDAGLLGYQDGFTIYDDGDQKKVINDVCSELGLKNTTADQLRRIISTVKNADEGTDEMLKSPNPAVQAAAPVFTRYQRRLKEQNAMDFDDLMLNALDLLRKHPERREFWQKRFGYILIDEYQDTNPVQYAMVRLLASHGNIMVVGDDDQSIYSWRGADLNNILDFEKDYPGAHVVKLEQNYRSTANILKAASSVICKNKVRKDKTLKTTADDGDLISLHHEEDEQMEARRCSGIAKKALASGRTAAIFYRTNSQSRTVEEALRREGVPYVMVGGVRFYDRMEIKDALSWMRVLVNPRDMMALERAVTAPRRGIGEKTLEAYRNYANSSYEGNLIDAMCAQPPAEVRGGGKVTAMGEIFRKWQWAIAEEVPLEEICERVIVDSGMEEAYEKEGTDEAEERLNNLRELVSACRDYRERMPEGNLAGFLEEVALVTDSDGKKLEGDKACVLMTLHTSKGLEFDEVCISGCEEGLFPLARQDADESAMEEERRLFYVGVTRARVKLHLFECRQRLRFGMREASIGSRFLDEVDPSVLEHVGAPALGRSEGAPNRFQGHPGYTRTSSSRPAAYQMPLTSRKPPPAPVNATKGVVMPDYDSENQSQVSAVSAGMKVKHASFGVGTVLKVHGMGASARLDIQFGKVTKRLVATFVTPL